LGWSLGVLAFGGALASLYFEYAWVAVTFLSLPVMTVAKALIDTARTPSPQPTTPPQQKAETPSTNQTADSKLDPE